MPIGQDLVAIGADLAPGTILNAYRYSCFPMPVEGLIGWFCPEHRGVLWPANLRVSRSLRKSSRRFTATVNTAFDQVLAGCADPERTERWIDEDIAEAYTNLHTMGWVHSVEVWDDEELAGGLYGIGMGSFFAGESMFHRKTDASKVALMHLVKLVTSHAQSPGSPALIDVQWLTPHLASLGAGEISRTEYRNRLTEAIATPGPFPIPDWIGDQS